MSTMKIDRSKQLYGENGERYDRADVSVSPELQDIKRYDRGVDRVKHLASAHDELGAELDAGGHPQVLLGDQQPKLLALGAPERSVLIVGKYEDGYDNESEQIEQKKERGWFYLLVLLLTYDYWTSEKLRVISCF